MIHLNILVEGSTELRFVKAVLAPHLAQGEIFAYPIAVLTSKDKRASRESRGGVTSYRQVKADLLRLMGRDHAKRSARFTTMIDLYRLPNDFPGTQTAKAISDPWRRVSHLEGEFGRDIDCSRFLPYIQLHEFEALLLSAPDKFRMYYSGQEYQKPISSLKTLVPENASPEEIDDGETTAPSKRIIAQMPAYEDDKAHAGPLIAQSIGLPLLRRRCPHFDEWLAKLESLGQRDET